MFFCSLILSATSLFAQSGSHYTKSLNRDPSGRDFVWTNGRMTENSNVDTAWREGYLVYEGDTVKGYISFDVNEVVYHRQIDERYFYEARVKTKDTKLSAVVTFRKDGKAMYLTRLKPKDKKMVRLLHDGKLKVYDDKLGFIYKPSDVSNSYLLVSYNGITEELGSLFSMSTKYDLIGYVNEVYHTKLVANNTSWDELWKILDDLD